MITAEVNQSVLKGGQKLPNRVIEKVLKVVSKETKVKGKKRISLAFITQAQIKKLNEMYRGKDAATDVLSFGLGEGDQLGEVLISYQQAKKQAEEMKHSTRTELQFLLVHGVLHLLGHDHEKPAESKKMFSVQERILKSLKINPEL
jgi:probable rRNA maturation factor